MKRHYENIILGNIDHRLKKFKPGLKNINDKVPENLLRRFQKILKEIMS
jgi:hypothetical protein